jgi:hypothetical protein
MTSVGNVSPPSVWSAAVSDSVSVIDRDVRTGQNSFKPKTWSRLDGQPKQSLRLAVSVTTSGHFRER